MCEVSWRYGELLAVSGRAGLALEHIERAEVLCAASEDRRELGCVQRTRARLLAAIGDDAAGLAFEQAWTTCMQTGRVLEAALTGIAHVAWETDQGRKADARTRLDQVHALLCEHLGGSTWIERVESEFGALRRGGDSEAHARCSAPRYGIVTRSPEMLATLDALPSLATTPYPVLLIGESGTGKELFARAIHTTAGRAGNWIAINCAAVPRDLFESELFGHARGAFSGAQGEKPGLFELAAGGTLFLDEIGELPLDLQAKLLRVLDDGEVRRVGEVRSRQVDVKIVAATNRPLEPMVSDGRFRGDLFHRLAVHALYLEPLRERPEDIEPLAKYLLQREGLAARLDLTPELLADLETRTWSGNARELRNVLVRLATQQLGIPVAGAPRPIAVTASNASSLRATRSSHERRIIEAALSASGGSVATAARSLRLHVTTLRRKMRALGVERPA
jgi:transcriptional regulator with GAF, ATPase, and Fis domain